MSAKQIRNIVTEALNNVNNAQLALNDGDAAAAADILSECFSDLIRANGLADELIGIESNDSDSAISGLCPPSAEVVVLYPHAS